VPEDGAQDGACGGAFGVGRPWQRCATTMLWRVDHLAHDAAGAVGGAREDGREAELLGGDFLEVAEEDVGRGVAAGEGDAGASR